MAAAPVFTADVGAPCIWAGITCALTELPLNGWFNNGSMLVGPPAGRGGDAHALADFATGGGLKRSCEPTVSVTLSDDSLT